MRQNNGLTTILVFFVIMIILSTVFSFVINFFPLILIIGLSMYAYKNYKLSKRIKEEQEQQEQDNVYENFFDNQTVEDNSFNKEKFFSEDQNSDLKIVDAQVLEKKDN